jgi:hypothetical protein
VRPKTRLLSLAALSLAAAVPSTAHAAESFVGVTGGDRLVSFHSDTAPGLTRPVAVAGLPAGERLVALDARPGAGAGLLALSTSGAVYALDAARHNITGKVAALPAAVPARAAATLTVAADGRTARAIAGGRDATIDLATGTLVRDAAAPTPLALDAGADGGLRGLDPAAGAIVSLDDAGTHVLAPLGGLKAAGATAATTASDGSIYAVTELAGRNAYRQSRMLRFDPATGQARGINAFFQRDIDAIAATGAVADDTTAPRASVTIPRQSVRDALRTHGIVADVTSSEPGQSVMSVFGGQVRGLGLLTADVAGRHRIVVRMSAAKIRAAAGRRLRVHLAVHDWANNTKTIDTAVRLTR